MASWCEFLQEEPNVSLSYCMSLLYAIIFLQEEPTSVKHLLYVMILKFYFKTFDTTNYYQALSLRQQGLASMHFQRPWRQDHNVFAVAT
jgi:hypothetical protein